MTHPYFVRKARHAFAAAGGDPDRTDALAAWAEATKRRQNRPHGVIVAQDGTLLAETAHVTGWSSATYVDTALIPAASLLEGWEVGIAVHRVPGLIGQGAAEVRTSELCFGPGQAPANAQVAR